MGESPAASPTRSPKKSPKKKRAARPKKTGPSVRDLIVKAVAASKQRNGVSLAALKKALKAGGYNVEKNKARVKLAVKALVTNGTLVHTKGTGASGSFKLNKKADKPTKKKAVSKAKKSPVKKKAKAKKARKSPKKAKKPAAKKAKAPKKAKKRTAAKKTKSPKKAKAANKRKVSKGKKVAAKKK